MSDLRDIRVTVQDAWDEITLPAGGETPIRDLKRRALAAARVGADPARYLVKFRGAEVRDESVSVAALGVPAGGAMIVLSRRRRAVR